MTERSVYFVYGLRGEDELFAFVHDNSPHNNLTGMVKARRERGWKVHYRRLEQQQLERFVA